MFVWFFFRIKGSKRLQIFLYKTTKNKKKKSTNQFITQYEKIALPG